MLAHQNEVIGDLEETKAWWDVERYLERGRGREMKVYTLKIKD